MKITFISSLFGNRGNWPAEFERIEGCNYFLFSDKSQSDFNTSWDVYNIHDNPIISQLDCNIRKSRYAKFLGWELLNSMGIEHDVIFYCDVHYSPNPKLDWHTIIESMQHKHFPLIQDIHDSITNRVKGGISEECELIINARKDSLSNVRKTISFFKKQYPHVNLSKPPYYRNTVLGYLPNNLVKSLTSSFWDIYTTKNITYRDQPLWNVLLLDQNLTPMIIKNFHQTYFKHTGIYGNHFYT